MRGLLFGGLAAAWSITGTACAEGERDPLSVSVIDDISLEHGDASGTDWSGTYGTTYALESCDCPSVEVDMGDMTVEFDICAAIDFTPESGDAPTDVLQTDGLLVMNLQEVGQMTGPIDADGSFSVASHVNLDSLLFENQFLGRIDGSFGDEGGTRRFEGVYRQRVVADYLGQDIDCRAAFDVAGERVD